MAKSKTKTKSEFYYWLAVNGPSVSISPIPLPETVNVSPTPELLIGFSEYDEATQIHQFLLNTKIENVNKYMQTLPEKLKSNEIQQVIRPKNPEPCSYSTVWSAD